MASNDVAYRLERAKLLLTFERLVAGAEYVQRIMTLGFDPDIAAWVYRGTEDDIQLVLISDIVRRVGSKRMYEVLFEAYERAVTPKQVDPFEVGLYSMDMDLAKDLLDLQIVAADGKILLNGVETDVSKMLWNFGSTVPKIVHGSGIYRIKSSPAKATELNPAWHRFEDNVQREAA